MGLSFPYPAAYLAPELARANLALSRQLNEARRAARRRAEQIKADAAQLVRLGWSADAAQDMAETKARMEDGE